MKNVFKSSENNIEGISSAFLWIYNQIAGWEKALVSSILWWDEKEVTGPAKVIATNSLRMFNKIELRPGQKIQVYNPDNEEVQNIDSPWIHFIHPDAIVIQYQKIILNEWEKAWLYDENWEYEEVAGPKVIYEHPEGKLERFSRVQLSEREAIIKVQQNGKEEIISGKDTPEIYINPVVEKLKNFSWTGSWEGGPDSQKVPGMIQFQVLRLDNSQTYFSFPVRTQDNVVIDLKLMIFYMISDVTNLVKNTHDPMCEFYNKLQATITSQIAKLKFDDFKEGTGKRITDMKDLQEMEFENIGLSIDEIVLREWEPEEKRVQDILQKAAMVESQKWLDKADNERTLQLLSFEMEQAEKQKELWEIRKENAQQEGERQGAKLAKILHNLQEEAGKEEGLALMKLYLAKDANYLNIWSEILK